MLENVGRTKPMQLQENATENNDVLQQQQKNESSSWIPSDAKRYQVNQQIVKAPSFRRCSSERKKRKMLFSMHGLQMTVNVPAITAI